jgi:hypothetical protein
MKRMGMRSSNLRRPIRDGRLGSSGSARRWLARVEPSARSGGFLATRSTEDGGSHHGLRRHRRGRAWAGDKEADMRKDVKVRGGLWCSSDFGSSPGVGGGGSSSLVTKRARPRHSEIVRRR